jgi:FixJ family two-component response regulator
MPRLTAFELQEKLASKGIRIPVIAIAVFDDAETRERVGQLGAAAFFRKPVEGQALFLRLIGPRDRGKQKKLDME